MRIGVDRLPSRGRPLARLAGFAPSRVASRLDSAILSPARSACRSRQAADAGGLAGAHSQLQQLQNRSAAGNLQAQRGNDFGLELRIGQAEFARACLQAKNRRPEQNRPIVRCHRGHLCHLHPARLIQLNQPLSLQVLIGAADGREIDTPILRPLADAGQELTWPQLPGPDERRYPIGDLHRNWRVGFGVQAQANSHWGSISKAGAIRQREGGLPRAGRGWPAQPRPFGRRGALQPPLRQFRAGSLPPASPAGKWPLQRPGWPECREGAWHALRPLSRGCRLRGSLLPLTGRMPGAAPQQGWEPASFDRLSLHAARPARLCKCSARAERTCKDAHSGRAAVCYGDELSEAGFPNPLRQAPTFQPSIKRNSKSRLRSSQSRLRKAKGGVWWGTGLLASGRDRPQLLEIYA